MRDNFLREARVPISVCSYEFGRFLLRPVYLIYLSLPLWPHIQGSDVQRTCRLNFWYYYFPFWVFALWNVVPSRPLSLCSWLEPPNFNHCVRVFLNIYNCSLPVLMCPLTNNSVDPLPWLSWSGLPYIHSNLFSSHSQPPTPPTCPDISAIIFMSSLYIIFL